MMMENKNPLDIVGDNSHKSKYDPKLAEEFNKQVEDEERLKELRKKVGKGEPEDSKNSKDVPIGPRPEISGVQANADLSDYIFVPEKDVLISRYPVFSNIGWDDAHFALAKKGLYMPRIDVFLQHFKNVRDAAAEKTASALYDGEGNMMSQATVNDLRRDLVMSSHTFYLDALFGKSTLDTNHRVIGGKLEGTSEPLEKYLDASIFTSAELDSLNKQGLPTKRMSLIRELLGLENRDKYIYFVRPVEGAVAAYEGRSRHCLNCDKRRFESNLVFACCDVPQKLKRKLEQDVDD